MSLNFHECGPPWGTLCSWGSGGSIVCVNSKQGIAVDKHVACLFLAPSSHWTSLFKTEDEIIKPVDILIAERETRHWALLNTAPCTLAQVARL